LVIKRRDLLDVGSVWVGTGGCKVAGRWQINQGRGAAVYGEKGRRSEGDFVFGHHLLDFS